VTPFLKVTDKALGVVVLVSTDGLLVGTGTICSRRFGRIPFTGVRGLRDFAIDNQGMGLSISTWPRTERCAH
jgi:hypothetical protein